MRKDGEMSMNDYCDNCGTCEVDSHFRYTTEGALCPDCFKEYIKNNEEAHVDAFCAKNESGFLLTFFKAGETTLPFDDQWWMETIQAGLDRYAQLHPEDVEALKREFIEHSDSSFEDFVVEQELEKSREGAA